MNRAGDGLLSLFVTAWLWIATDQPLWVLGIAFGVAWIVNMAHRRWITADERRLDRWRRTLQNPSSGS